MVEAEAPFYVVHIRATKWPESMLHKAATAWDKTGKPGQVSLTSFCVKNPESNPDATADADTQR